MWPTWSWPSLTLPWPRVPSLLLAFLPNCHVCAYFLTCGERILLVASCTAMAYILLPSWVQFAANKDIYNLREMLK